MGKMARDRRVAPRACGGINDIRFVLRVDVNLRVGTGQSKRGTELKIQLDHINPFTH